MVPVTQRIFRAAGTLKVISFDRTKRKGGRHEARISRILRNQQLFGKSDSWARVTYYRAKAMITAKLEEGEK